MPNRNDTWGVILAGGNGTRLSTLTTDDDGVVIPKQFCSLGGSKSLLQEAIERTTNHVAHDRVIVVVAEEHRKWWEPQLAGLNDENVVVQPCDRGTACGVLLPLMHINRQNPEATVVVTPSDQHFDDERIFHLSLMEALSYVTERPRLLVLLGMEPDSPVTDYGWITTVDGSGEAVRLVTSFIEKPDQRAAKNLLQHGALWSTFIFVSSVKALLSRFRFAVPWLVDRFERALEYGFRETPNQLLPELYERLPAADFSRSVLQKCDDTVHVLAVPPCGWTDLGTPERVAACVGKKVPCSMNQDDCEVGMRPPLDLTQVVAGAATIDRGSPLLS